MAAVPVGGRDEAGGRKLGVQTVFGHEHQVRETPDGDTGADVLQTDRWSQSDRWRADRQV